MDIPWPIKTAERACRSFWSTDRSVIIECGLGSSEHFLKSIGCSILVSGTTFLNCGMALETIFHSPSTPRMWPHSFNNWLLVQSTYWVILAAVLLFSKLQKNIQTASELLFWRMQLQGLSFPKRKRI